MDRVRHTINREAACLALICGAVVAGALRAPAQAVSSYAVQVSAAVQTNPAAIALSWPADPGATNYTLYRKLRDSPDWGSSIELAANATGYVDTNVAVGSAFEYRIIKSAATYWGRGYIYSGIAVPLVENRGKVVLVVDNSQTTSLAVELARLQQDLVGDGWTVLRHDVARMAVEPADPSSSVWAARSNEVVSLKALIQADYAADPADVKAVFLFGHLPVPYSGSIAPDGHTEHQGAWPADVYYGDMDGTWHDSSVTITGASDPRNRNVPGDGKFDEVWLTTELRLQVGRVDLANLPAFTVSETELLRRYLNKDHKFRHKQITAERRGLIDDNLGYLNGEVPAVSGWRNFAAFFGPGNSFAGDWLTTLATQSYLWGYACGAGTYTSASGVGNTLNLVTNDTQVVFTMLFGSYFGDWDSQDNFLRAQLATTNYTLTSAWVCRPRWEFHHMALGETIGFSTRLSQNDDTLYDDNYYARYIHTALMGDPALRMHPVAPPSALVVTSNASGGVDLSWNASPDTVAGYHVYRATPSASGLFQRLTPEPIPGTSYTDPVVTSNIYMVRAVKLEVSGSGTYWNASQGIFQSLDGTLSAPSLYLDEPTNHSSFVAPATIVVDAATLDFSNRITKVEFYTNGVRLGEKTGPPYSVTWSNVPVGTYILSARATYGAGQTLQSSPVTTYVDPSLVATGSVWKYLDTGADLGTAWRAPDYDDGAWAAGSAKLGYGNDAVTVVSFGSDPFNPNTSTYFRRAFTTENQGLFTNLTLGLLRDDGAVVYLNGSEVFRSNMPEGPIDCTTLASLEMSSAADSTFFRTNVDPALLVAGTNVLAVEVHLAQPYSPALGFDLFLSGRKSSYLPVLTITATSTNKVYGAPLPAFTPLYSGFTNGDTPASLNALPVLSVPATSASPVGTYPIQPSGAVSSNYAIQCVEGTLAILPAACTGLVTSATNPSLPGLPVAFTFALGAVPPGAGTPTGTAQFQLDGASAGAPIVLSGGAATYTNAGLAHGLHTVGAEYAGDGNFCGTTNLLLPAQLADTPPVPGPVTVQRDPATGVKVSVATLLSSASDADADLLVFTGVSAASAYGGMVVSNAGWVFYTPASGFTNTDTFTYAVSDGWAAPVNGLVTVIVGVDNSPSPNLTISGAGTGPYLIRGDGIPARTYQIQFTDDSPTTNWRTLGPALADPYGVFQLTDPSGAPQRFYRSVYP